MSVKLNLIAAACENMGIGKNNNLPWRLNSEMNYFTKMTSTTADINKRNIVIMGRRTWDSIPPKYKPLPNRINFVLSRSNLDISNYKDSYSFTSFDELLDKLHQEEFKKIYENIWVIGGSHIYEESMKSKYFHRLYMTEIKKKFDCDTFFPEFDKDFLKEISDPLVPTGLQSELGIEYMYKVYENSKFCK